MAKGKKSLGNERGVPSKQQLYLLAASYGKEAIECLVQEMRHGDSSASRVGAAKVIAAKCIPDLKATELTDDGAKTLEGLVQLFTNKSTSV